VTRQAVHGDTALIVAPAAVRAPWGYRMLAWAVPLFVVWLCFVAARIGSRQWDDRTRLFHPIDNVSHPGVMTVVTALGWMSIAVVCGLLAVLLHEVGGRWWWSAVAVAAVLVGEEMIRVHEWIPGGDVLVRAALAAGVVVTARGVRGMVRTHRGAVPAALGLLLLVASELFGFAGGDVYRRDSMLDLLEESAACVGAWLLAVAALGVATTLLAPQRAAAE
jgi:hypothetical protein